MKSALRRRSNSDAEVTNVSQHGFWIFVDDRELFLPFEKFPWFRNAPISHILRVERPHPTHLYWPALDVDLAVKSIEFPERFPLLSSASPGGALLPSRSGHNARTKKS
jgi:uncharacterized protein DUF2442